MNRPIHIAHECPNSIFEEVMKETDYDYFLSHLIQENKDYYTHFMYSKSQDRKSILDNSIFEGLGLSNEQFAEQIKSLSPNYYIVPDILENAAETIWNYYCFTRKYRILPGKKIGVLQGKTYEELCNCYKALLELGVDRVAISFDYSYYQVLVTNEDKLVSWSLGRQEFINRLMKEDFFRESTSIHLLGCSLASEFKLYSNRERYHFVKSIDTSNPVVCGLKGFYYTPNGNLHKPSQKLCTMVSEEVNEETKRRIIFNIREFKKLCNNETNSN